MEFYYKILSKALETGRVGIDDSVLAVCAGTHDRNSFMRAGFGDVTISNVNDYMGDDVAPYKWQHIDAENIPHPDGSFDIVAVHGGLHHCFSPHRGMLEMYRVARKAVIVVEARNSAMMRAAVKLGLTDDYEIEAVTGSNHFGGAGGGAIPNYVYRWTEAEVFKTVATFEPRYEPDIDFIYGLLLPTQRLESTKRPLMRLAARTAKPAAKALHALLPKQGNRFGWIIWKDSERLHPWLRQRPEGEIEVDAEYVKAKGRVYNPVNAEMNAGNPGLTMRDPDA